VVLALWLYGSGSLATGSLALAQPVFFNDEHVVYLMVLWLYTVCFEWLWHCGSGSIQCVLMDVMVEVLAPVSP